MTTENPTCCGQAFSGGWPPTSIVQHHRAAVRFGSRAVVRCAAGDYRCTFNCGRTSHHPIRLERAAVASAAAARRERILQTGAPEALARASSCLAQVPSEIDLP